MNTIEKTLAEQEYTVELVTGLNTHGQPVYAYVLVRKIHLAQFRQSLADADTYPDEFGVILATGEGHDPAPEVWQAVQAKLKKTA